jgi:transposase
VYFPEGKDLALHHLYRAMDLLDRHKEEIEEALYWKLGDLLNLDVDLIFYDTTSVYFEIDEEDDLRKLGYGKDGRNDCPQIVVGLAVTRDGFPVKSWVFPGNTSDVSTISRVKEDLRGWKLNRCIFVTDAGMSSEENLHTLALGGGRYITAMSCIRGSEVVDEVLARPGRFSPVADNLEVKEVWVGDGERRRRYVVCRNPLEVTRQSEHREEVLAQLEAELATLKGHPKRACRLFSSKRYGKYLRKLKSGELRIDRKAVQTHAKRDGLWVIRTNDESLSSEDLALAYKQLMRVEEAWRTMKSGLELRPMHHRTEARIRAHVYLCVLALLIERVAEKATGETWRTIRNALRTQKIGQLFSPAGRLFQVSKPSNEVCKLYKLMQIEAPPPLLNVEQHPE